MICDKSCASVHPPGRVLKARCTLFEKQSLLRALRSVSINQRQCIHANVAMLVALYIVHLGKLFTCILGSTTAMILE